MKKIILSALLLSSLVVSSSSYAVGVIFALGATAASNQAHGIGVGGLSTTTTTYFVAGPVAALIALGDNGERVIDLESSKALEILEEEVSALNNGIEVMEEESVVRFYAMELGVSQVDVVDAVNEIADNGAELSYSAIAQNLK